MWLLEAFLLFLFLFVLSLGISYRECVFKLFSREQHQNMYITTTFNNSFFITLSAYWMDITFVSFYSEILGIAFENFIFFLFKFFSLFLLVGG